MTERKHRSIKNHEEASLTERLLTMKVAEITETHAILESQETGHIRWPLSKLPKNLKKGDAIQLGLPTKSEPLSEAQHLATLQKLLAELID